MRTLALALLAALPACATLEVRECPTSLAGFRAEESRELGAGRVSLPEQRPIRTARTIAVLVESYDARPDDLELSDPPEWELEIAP